MQPLLVGGPYPKFFSELWSAALHLAPLPCTASCVVSFRMSTLSSSVPSFSSSHIMKSGLAARRICLGAPSSRWLGSGAGFHFTAAEAICWAGATALMLPRRTPCSTAMFTASFLPTRLPLMRRAPLDRALMALTGRDGARSMRGGAD